jgi:phage shock protein PspC (stress-responsive transcriptional regulator)
METNGPDDQADSDSTERPTEAGGHDPGSAGDRRPEGHPKVETDPAKYTVQDEPLGGDAPVDWRYLYEIVAKRADRELDRGSSFDGKLAALLAGVVAGIGFSFRISPSPVTTWAAFLYIIPLVFILDAFLTRLGKEAPTPKSLAEYFPTYPVTTLKSAVAAMVEAAEFDKNLNDRKASRIAFAVLALGIVTALVILAQIVSLYVSPVAISNGTADQTLNYLKLLEKHVNDEVYFTRTTIERHINDLAYSLRVLIHAR